MNLATTARLAVVILALPLAAAALEPGEGIHEPVVLPSGSELEPTLESIQANLFTPGCALSSCHGAAMSALLDLRAGAAYSNLVDVASVEVPTWDRVEPFNPDQSYLICKLENCPSIIGQQMPLIGGPLDQSVINVVRQWILAGAPETSGVPVEATSWGQVKAIYR